MAKYSLAEAANLLKISKQAVVLRIKRGSLSGSKDESGQWVVNIDNHEGPTGGQQEPREGPTGGQQEPSERRPRRENDDALLENNKFLQLTTASNQELVARLTKSIEDQRSHLENQKLRESKAWMKSVIIFGSLVIGLFVYFTNEKTQIKDEYQSLKAEIKSEHQTAVKSYENTLNSLGTKHQEEIKSIESRHQEVSKEHQARSQEVKRDYQARYQELSNDYEKKETLLQEQIDLLKFQNKELMELLKNSTNSGNLRSRQ